MKRTLSVAVGVVVLVLGLRNWAWAQDTNAVVKVPVAFFDVRDPENKLVRPDAAAAAVHVALIEVSQAKIEGELAEVDARIASMTNTPLSEHVAEWGKKLQVMRDFDEYANVELLDAQLAAIEATATNRYTDSLWELMKERELKAKWVARHAEVASNLQAVVDAGPAVIVTP